MGVAAVLIAVVTILGQINALLATTAGIQYNLPSCQNTVQQGDVCGSSNPIAGTCCPIGMSCSQSSDNSTFVCMESSNLSWDFAPPSCTQHLHPSDTCGSDSAPCIDALCIVVLPTSTCCPDGYLCMGSSDGTGSHACQPSIFPVVPPNLMRPRLVSNASLINDALLNAVLPPLPSSAIPVLPARPVRIGSASRGLKASKEKSTTPHVQFAPPQVAGAVALAALPAALPAAAIPLIAGGVGPRDASGALGGVLIPPFGPGMAPTVAPVLVPAPGPYMPALVPGPAPMDSPSMAPAPGPYMPPLVPVPAPMEGPSMAPAPSPYMPPLAPGPAPVDGPSIAPAPADPFAPAPWTYSPMMAPWSSEPWAPAPGPFKSGPRRAGPPQTGHPAPGHTPSGILDPGAPAGSGTPSAPADSGTPAGSGTPGPPAGSGIPGPPAGLGTPGTPGPPAGSGTPGTPGPPAGSGTPGPPAGSGTPGTPGPPAGSGTPGAPGPPAGSGTPGTPGRPAGLGTPGTPGPPAGSGTPGTPGPPAGSGIPGTPGPPAGSGTPGNPGPPAGLGTPGPPTPGTPGAPGPPTGPTKSGTPPPLKLVDDTFVNANTGDVVELHGMSWFGFNNGQTMVDGLYAGSTYQIADFKTIVFRQQQLGFNAVRLPMTFSDLNLAPKSWTKSCTDDTASLKADLEDPDAPYSAINYGAESFPAFTPLGGGTCNVDLPNDSTLNRYLFVIEYYVSQGFYVLVDYHAYPGDTTVASGNLLGDWQTLWTAISGLPTFATDLAGRVFLDLINEPDGINVRWEAANGNPALADLYIDTMDALDAINDNAIYFIEGAGQSSFVTAWGDGFVTDPTILSANGLSDPRPFFDTLATKPYLDRVVLSPHMYGPSVTGGSVNVKTGANLFNRLSQSSGVLAKFGYTPGSGGTAHRFPIAIGEFGTTFVSSDDMAWLHDFSEWKNNIAPANDGLHDNVNSYFYWCWNANSGDTGGLVDDSWLTIQWPKVDFLTVSPNPEAAANAAAPGGWGLTPWYLSR